MNIIKTKIFNEGNIVVLNSLVKRYPNDADLGNRIRKLFGTDILVMSLPNDRELGSEIHKITNLSK